MKITPAALTALANGETENAMIAMTPGGIEAQEAAGQQAFCAASKIPIEMIRCTRQDFEALGFLFPETQSDDPLFVHVTMPAGWTTRPTEHSMWSHIVDATGTVRFEVFYKAAFYDRHAHIWPASAEGK